MVLAFHIRPIMHRFAAFAAHLRALNIVRAENATCAVAFWRKKQRRHASKLAGQLIWGHTHPNKGTIIRAESRATVQRLDVNWQRGVECVLISLG